MERVTQKWIYRNGHIYRLKQIICKETKNGQKYLREDYVNGSGDVLMEYEFLDDEKAAEVAPGIICKFR